MKKLCKALNNYRLSCVVSFFIQLFTVIASIVMLIAYSFAGDDDGKMIRPAFYWIRDNKASQYCGMVFFLSAVLSIVLSCVVIYLIFPGIKNKDKLNPTKLPFIVSACNAVFHITLIILTVVLFVGIADGTWPEPNTQFVFIIGAVLSALVVALDAISIYPIVRCELYQPDIKSKK